VSKTVEKWKRLDHAALIFPSSSTKTDTHVFRFSCELDEEIDGQLLGRALDDTIERLPVFGYVMKRGLFWYYLETTDRKPVVTEESRPPCDVLYDHNSKGLLYEVTYYRNTINFEVYHVLTDGTGAMHFLRTLVTRYLSYSNGIPETPIDYDASHAQMEDDGFRRYYSGERPKRKVKGPKAYQLHGQKLHEDRLGIIRGHMSVKAALAEAKKHGVTLTVFMCAVLICAIGDEMTTREKDKPAVISIPVNLRNYFRSESARNFFCLIRMAYDFQKRSGEFEDVLGEVKKYFETELTRENLEDRIGSWAVIESNPFVKISPLWFKDIVLRIAYLGASKKYTATFSNIGILKLPEEYACHVKAFDVCNSTHKMQACMCSHGDTLSISFASPYLSTDIQRGFFRRLAEMGLDIEIISNLNVE